MVILLCCNISNTFFWSFWAGEIYLFSILVYKVLIEIINTMRLTIIKLLNDKVLSETEK